MRAIEGLGNLVLVVMAAASLISMIAAYSLDMIVNGDLYLYGLNFNYGWFISFETVIGIVYAMAWLNIIVAIVFQVYRIRRINKAEAQDSDE
jgi:hypothetical protein